MNDVKDQAKLAAKVKRFRDEPTFLKFMRRQTDAEKEVIFKLLPENRFVKKYVTDRAKADQAGGEFTQTLSAKDYRQAKLEIETLIEKSPLNAPYLNDIQQDRFFEPRISYFNARPKMDPDQENDAKYLFRIINTHLTRKSSTYTKEELEKMLVKISRKRRAIYRLQEADMRTNLALHNWILARSKTMSKSEKNDLFITALKNVSQALYMGGYSYFNVTSFGMMHNEYMNNYRQMLEEKMKQVMQHAELYKYLPVMRNHLGGLDLLKNSTKYLNSRLINLFETHSLDFKLKKLYTSDFKKALANYLKRKPDKMINGIHSKVYVFLYLDLLIYLSCITRLQLPEMLSEAISLTKIMDKDYDLMLRGKGIEIRRLLYQFYHVLSKKEEEPEPEPEPVDPKEKNKKKEPVDLLIEEKEGPTAFSLLCKIMAACNQMIYAIRKKSDIDRYIEVKYTELYPLYRYFDALIKYIPGNEINKDIKVFTVNFLRDGLFFKQQAIARQKEDKIINVIQKMMDILKATYKRRVDQYKSSMIDDGEPDYTKTGGDEAVDPDAETAEAVETE